GRFKITTAQLDRLARHCIHEQSDGLVSTVAGNVFQRQDLMRWLTKNLFNRGVHMKSAKMGQSPARPVWLIVIDENFYFGFPRFNYHDVRSRSRSADRVGSLPPVIAAAMCFAAKPEQHEVVWDPVMGTGTVLSEVAAQVPKADLIGTDNDPLALQLA